MTPSTDETALVERARVGDEQAFASLVRRYQEIAFRTAYVITGGADEADDATQEGFLKAYQALPRFRVGAPFRPWLLEIVANQARNRRRSAARRERLAARFATRTADAVAVSSPEAAALWEERRRDLVAAIDRLREEDQVVVQCRYFLELSEAETAAALGWPRGTVKSRLSRALLKLRDDLSAAGRHVVEPRPGTGR